MTGDRGNRMTAEGYEAGRWIGSSPDGVVGVAANSSAVAWSSRPSAPKR